MIKKEYQMNHKFLKMAFAGVVLSVSSFTNAGLITHNNYTLDTNTNIVTGNGIEWLQWSETIGESITSSLATYATDGWVLAGNDRMASLFSDFGWSNGNSETSAFVTTTPYTAADDNSIMDNFIELFGVTRIGNHPSYGTGINNLFQTNALFGDDANGNSLYQDANIRSDYLFQGNPTSYAALMYQENTYTTASSSSLYGVALVRNAQSVPEPSTLAIVALGIMGLASRRFKKQS
ncbi:MAG: hypothetical protein ACJAV0_001704 [Shewanella sp.]|jgi:hypothetical protein